MPCASLRDGYGRRYGGGALHSCSRLILSTSLPASNSKFFEERTTISGVVS
jgi:hypothetical protein